MKLVIASNNEHKIMEIKQILGEHFSDIKSMKQMGIDIEVEEDGATFEENALKKASEIFKIISNCAVLADDSGLTVDYLLGAPGVLSARFAGEGHDDAANNEKLLQAMSGVPAENRACQFVCCIALCRPGKQSLLACGKCDGIVAQELSGSGGFGYDPLFYIKSKQCTYAQLSAQEKNTISHRAKALALLNELLRQEKHD